MNNVVVIGTQWGDEGKGKIVDWLSKSVDAVCRFQGGHNAGHTLVIDGTTYKLSLLPSGIVRKNSMSFIGNGVVIDPEALLAEIAKLRGQGVEISPNNLMIAENAPLILRVHSLIDKAREKAKGKALIGTTGRGIGPAYEDKIARRALRVIDLKDDDILEQRLGDILRHHNIYLSSMGEPILNSATELGYLKELRAELLSYSGTVWRELNRMESEGKSILFEGAQGMLLDIDFGTYPFVTSSNIGAGQVSNGLGIGVQKTGFALGITKAYTTRVGSGPFPTELFDQNGQRLGERGHEFGTVTGRQRRCGWFDAVLVKQTCLLSGINGLAFTKLDVLDGFDQVHICVGYKLGDQTLDYFPHGISDQAAVEPIYETMDGWQEDTAGIRDFAKLPLNAQRYVRRVEELVGTPIALLSTSPERDDTILIQDPFNAF